MHESAQTSNAMAVSCMSFDLVTVPPSDACDQIGGTVAVAQATPKRAGRVPVIDPDRADVSTFNFEWR
jgi:hypothetical protein